MCCRSTSRGAAGEMTTGDHEASPSVLSSLFLRGDFDLCLSARLSLLVGGDEGLEGGEAASTGSPALSNPARALQGLSAKDKASRGLEDGNSPESIRVLSSSFFLFLFLLLLLCWRRGRPT